MANNRKTVFTNGEIYHIFNRGIEKRIIFSNTRDFQRAVDTFNYYRFVNPSLRFSHFIRLEKDVRKETLERLYKNDLQVEILSYCLMPNHFHFLLRQVNGNGISKFVANVTNSYTKFFNTKYDRVGPLVQGLFKAVHVDDDEQLIHVSRYIHLNPVTSYIIKPEEMSSYRWSSYPQYTGIDNPDVIEKKTVLNFFKTKNDYRKFVLDQVDYARTLEQIKHLTLEE